MKLVRTTWPLLAVPDRSLTLPHLLQLIATAASTRNHRKGETSDTLSDSLDRHLCVSHGASFAPHVLRRPRVLQVPRTESGPARRTG